MLIIELWKKQPGKYFCISTKSITGRWRDHFFTRKSLIRVPKFIRENKDKDLYMCPHGFDRKERKKQYAVDPYLLYADMDECNPRKAKIKPTIALESSPGRYVGYWVTDKLASEELNRRLTYMLGTDVSGWDRTQVLRIPNTRNYKYDNPPRVKTLWTNGPEYKIEDLEHRVPRMKTLSGSEINDRAIEVYKAYEKKLSRWARRELLEGKPKPGKRSEIIWKLQNACLEAGMSREEAFDVLWVSPWNKFRDRRDGADQLWRELDKSLSQHFEGYSVDGSKDNETWNPIAGSIADVEMENIDWLVPSMFARKEMTIVEGDPGLGKSYLMQMVSLLICDGKKIPAIEERYKPPQGRVVYFDTENTAGSVTKKRLVENGIVNQQNFFQGEEAFGIDDEDRWGLVVDRLEELRPTMIVFDTINTYIGGADTYRSSDTQQAMGYFKALAVRFDCCVVVLRHLTKGGKDKALYRGQGSIAFTGAARIVITVGQSPDDADTRVVACTKNNISQHFRSFTYRIDGLPDTLEHRNRSVLTWGEAVDWTSDDIVSVEKPQKNNDKENAIEWLKSLLSENPRMNANNIYEMSEARSISRSTLNRAAKSIEVIKQVEGFGKNKISTWSLP